MSSVANAAILFEPDGYTLTGPWLMGRQAAGNAFLRAAVAGRGGQAMWAYARTQGSGRGLRGLGAFVRWCH